MESLERLVIVYATNKIDTMCAAAIFSMWGVDERVTIRASNLTELLTKTSIEGTTVVLVDHVFPRHELIEVISACKALIHIGNNEKHHASLESVDPLNMITYFKNSDYSCAGLAWRTLFQTELPKVLFHLEEAYFGRLDDINTRIIRCAVTQVVNGFDSLREIILADDEKLKEIYRVGFIIHRERNRSALAIISRNTRKVELFGHIWTAVNVPATFKAEVVSLLDKPLILAYYDAPEGRFLSFHSKDESGGINLLDIVKHPELRGKENSCYLLAKWDDPLSKI